MKPYAVVGALAGVALIVTLAARRGASGAAPQAAVTPPTMLGAGDVAPAQRVDLVAGVPVSGTLEPAVDIRITSPVPEVVDAVLIKEGQAVRAGDVLARFRTIGLEPEALSAEARRRKAATDYERMQALLVEGAVSRNDVENAEVALRAAEAGAVQARKRLDEATVRAPVAGVIARRSVDAGDRVKDGDPLFQLVNTAELEFAAAVPSEFATRVRPGQDVALQATGVADGGLRGRVTRVNPTVDPATRQLTVYVAVRNTDGRLVGGLFASGRVVLREVRGAVAVPQAGVRAGENGAAYVWIVEGRKIARRDVTVGVADEAAGLVEIVSGLAGGETVVVGPAEGLRPGQAVTVAGGRE